MSALVYTCPRCRAIVDYSCACPVPPPIGELVGHASVDDAMTALASPLPVAGQGVVTEEMVERACRSYFRSNWNNLALSVQYSCRDEMRAALEASITKTAAPLGVDERDLLKAARDWIADNIREGDIAGCALLGKLSNPADLPIPAPDAQAVAVGWLFKVRGEGNPWNFTLNKFDNAAYEFERVYRFATPVTGEADVERLTRERDEARRKLFPHADANPICGFSYSGFYFISDEKGIAEFRRLENNANQIEVWRRSFDEHKAAAESRVEALTAEVERLSEIERLLSCMDTDSPTEHDNLIFETLVNDAKAAIRSRAASKGDGHD